MLRYSSHPMQCLPLYSGARKTIHNVGLGVGGAAVMQRSSAATSHGNITKCSATAEVLRRRIGGFEKFVSRLVLPSIAQLR